MKRTIYSLVLMALVLSCGRKDIDRDGQIRLRGEDPVQLDGRTRGEVIQEGTASWYGRKYHGRKTSNGETYNMYDHTAAHKTLPFHTIVRVVNQDNGKSTTVRINDRGPFIKGRIIDLSKRAAQDIGLDVSGLARVRIYLEGNPGATPSGIQSKPIANNQRTSKWTIQVGSFAEFLRARRLVERFESCGHRVRIEKFDSMYRVRIGAFSSKADAQVAARNLDLTGLDSWILED